MVAYPLTLRFIELRKQRGLSQQAMADAIGIHANSWKKYETGQAQPCIDVLRNISFDFSTRQISIYPDFE